MRLALVLAASVVSMPVLLADHQHVVSDDQTDFASLKTFAIREGRALTTRPELNSGLIFKKVEGAIRAEFVAKGLKESVDVPDVFVGFRIGEDRPNGPAVIFDEGTLLIDVTTRETRKLVWQGVYTDEKGSPAKVAEKLTGSVKKLLSAYPPKKKK